MNARIQVKHLRWAGETFRSATDLSPIRDEAHYRRMVAILEALLAEASGNENHTAMDLVDVLGDLIEDFEAVHHPLPDATGAQAPKFLMEQYGLNQGDLHEVGSQGVVSESLTDKRDLNIRPVRALSVRVGVSPATFV